MTASVQEALGEKRTIRGLEALGKPGKAEKEEVGLADVAKAEEDVAKAEEDDPDVKDDAKAEEEVGIAGKLLQGVGVDVVEELLRWGTMQKRGRR